MMWKRIFSGMMSVAVLAIGCAKPSPNPIRPASIEERFPVRSDWLVLSQPKATPTSWYIPGKPPLSYLDEPADTLSGDAALLLPEVKTGSILTTKTFKHFEEDPRPQMQAGLDRVFGTPAEPHIGQGAKTLEEKLAALKAKIDTTKDPDEKASLKEDLKPLQQLVDGNAELQQHITTLHLEPERLKTGGELYRNFCQQCHGATGNGDGPAAKYLVPLPRDYRTGLFKFLSSEPNDGGYKPRRHDLIRTIRNGLDGSAMPAFSGLKPAEIEDLVSYVLFLSIRGESEYQMLKIAADKRKADDFVPADIEKTLQQSAAKITATWQRSDITPLRKNTKDEDTDPNPYTTPEQRLEAAARGHRIFLDATQGGCTACHANYGRNSLMQFDSWGGMAQPRNLTLGTYRVSKSVDDLYTRLYSGIPGVGMPSHKHLLPTEAEKAAGQSRLWDLVYFVEAVGNAQQRKALKEKMGIDLGK